jgi:hypothetical protein
MTLTDVLWALWPPVPLGIAVGLAWMLSRFGRNEENDLDDR